MRNSAWLVIGLVFGALWGAEAPSPGPDAFVQTELGCVLQRAVEEGACDARTFENDPDDAQIKTCVLKCMNTLAIHYDSDMYNSFRILSKLAREDQQQCQQYCPDWRHKGTEDLSAPDG